MTEDKALFYSQLDHISDDEFYCRNYGFYIIYFVHYS